MFQIGACALDERTTILKHDAGHGSNPHVFVQTQNNLPGEEIEHEVE
jgi:hypothetical protein